MHRLAKPFTVHMHVLTIGDRPIPSFLMFHAEKREGLADTRLHVLDITNASKIINMGVVNCNTR